MRILFLLSRFPYPLEKGDKLRAFHFIKHLSKKHEILLFAITDRDINTNDFEALSPFCAHIEIFQMSKFEVIKNLCSALFTGLPLQSSYFFNSPAQNHLRRLINQKKPDRIFCQLIRMAPYIRFDSEIPCVLDYMDVFSAGLKRRMNKASFFFRWIFKMEFLRTKKYETFLMDKFFACSIISNQDRELLGCTERNNIAVIPNGVDFNFFTAVDSEKKFDLLFTGNMNYPPNIEAVRFICKRILPQVKKMVPGIKLCIAGTNPSNDILKMAGKDVTVTGWVDDIRPYYNSSKIFIAPMQTGTGLQNKLLEAMAMKIPCITSPLANNAINAIDKESVLIANTEDDYVRHVLYLLENPLEISRIGNAGFLFVRNNFNWDVNVGKLEELIENAGNYKSLQPC